MQANSTYFLHVVDENKIVYDRFHLAKKLHKNPEALLRKSRSHTASSSATPPTNKPVTPSPSAASAMTNKSLHEYSVPAFANVPVGHDVNTGTRNFELRTGLITMV